VTSQATNDSDVGITSEKAIENDIEEDNSTWSTMTITAEGRLTNIGTHFYRTANLFIFIYSSVTIVTPCVFDPFYVCTLKN